MLDWRTLTKDPNDPRASELVRAQIASRVAYYPGSRSEWLERRSAGKRVLDIGGGEHTSASSDSVSWEHAVLLRRANSVLGLDINGELVRSLEAKGFNFRQVDATSDTDLGSRYDFVFAGDVIEHVNDPVRLVKFALRHLAPGGTALFTTPNPWISADPIQSLLRRGGTRGTVRHVNLEHTCWVTPTNFYEILLRAGGELEALWIPESPGSSRARRSAHRLVRAYSRLVGLEENAYPEFAYEVTSRSGD